MIMCNDDRISVPGNGGAEQFTSMDEGRVQRAYTDHLTRNKLVSGVHLNNHDFSSPF
jgi:hypothetical protein